MEKLIINKENQKQKQKQNKKGKKVKECKNKFKYSKNYLSKAQ